MSHTFAGGVLELRLLLLAPEDSTPHANRSHSVFAASFSMQKTKNKMRLNMTLNTGQVNKMSTSVLLWLLSSTIILLAIEDQFSALEAAEDSNYEPQFPSILDPLKVRQQRVHIVSESVSEQLGYETIEEFQELELGKCTVLTTNKNGHRITHVDAQAGLMYRYKPYTCSAITTEDMKASSLDGLWHAVIGVRSTNSDDSSSMTNFHFYGVAALWVNAAQVPKAYARDVIHSVSKSVFTDAHKWTIEDDNRKSLIHLYFVENKSKTKSTKLSLEMIQIESKETNKIIQTFNLLSIEYSISDDILESLMMVPEGYGCSNFVATRNVLKEYPSLENFYFGPLMAKSHRIQLEATCNIYPNDGASIRADTINYELIRAQASDLDTMQLIRQRDGKQDIKSIFNYRLNVQYIIDMRLGECKMLNMGMQMHSAGMQIEKATLKFNNGFELIMDTETMLSLFADTKEFYFIKQVKRGSKDKEYLYFERTLPVSMFTRPSRVVRIYSKNKAKTENSFMYQLYLESVIIWIFDANFERVVESYHLNVIDASEISSLYELARAFDVSEECYLNNEQMRAGRDYAWFELTYPVPAGKHSDAIASHTHMVKEIIMGNYVKQYSHQSIFLLPRLEFMFEETKFILRVLMLDLPPLILLYDPMQRTVLAISQTGGSNNEKQNKLTSPLAEFVAPDLSHCAELCRLNDCISMSYCEQSYACLLLRNQFPLPPNSNTISPGQVQLVRSSACDTYTRPIDDESAGPRGTFENLNELRLHRALSMLQHLDYGGAAVPKIPDELVYPESETGLNPSERAKMFEDYKKQLFTYLNQNGHQHMVMVTFTLVMGQEMLVLMPSKFELEHDPMNEFDLAADSLDLVSNLDTSGSDNSGASIVASAFHEGLSMHRYKFNVFGEAEQKKSRQFTCLTYDQCALACADSRCSSFSYCSHRMECILTDIYTLGESISSLIEQDSDCFISQRDFLGKFQRFQNVYRPNVYKRSVETLNPSECAHSCMVETSFRCLAFDYCSPSSGQDDIQKLGRPGTCLLREQRLLASSFGGEQEKQTTDPRQRPSKLLQTGCDHYSRSFLADFNRIEYREIEPTQLSKFKATTLLGRTVDQCADVCINELTECSCFQFCLNPDYGHLASSTDTMQSCVLIEGRPDGGDNEDNFKVVFNDTAPKGEQVNQAGKFIKPNRNCHLFSLRGDSSVAHLRALALNSMSASELDANKQGTNANGGLSIGGGFILFLCVSVLSTAAGCGLVVAKENSEFLRGKFERARAWLRA